MRFICLLHLSVVWDLRSISTSLKNSAESSFPLSILLTNYPHYSHYSLLPPVSKVSSHNQVLTSVFFCQLFNIKISRLPTLLSNIKNWSRCCSTSLKKFNAFPQKSHWHGIQQKSIPKHDCLHRILSMLTAFTVIVLKALTAAIPVTSA